MMNDMLVDHDIYVEALYVVASVSQLKSCIPIYACMDTCCDAYLVTGILQCVYVMKSYDGATPMCAPILGEDPRVFKKARTACRALQVGIRVVLTVGAPLA